MKNRYCYVIDADKHCLQKVKTKDSSLYGWLSPEGDLIVSEFGRHKLTAVQIIDDDEHLWAHEEDKWCRSNPGKNISDFLVEVKRYVLIDNVFQCNDAKEMFVTHYGRLTAEQEAFLDLCRQERGVVFHSHDIKDLNI